MKSLFALALLLTALFGTMLPAEAALAKKQKPNRPKQIERTRRHLHQESMQRIHRAKMDRVRGSK